MTLTTATASADKYSRAWNKVEKYIREDLPESAVKEINHIWDMAVRDDDGRQMLKSAVRLTQVQRVYKENDLKEGIELFSSLLNTLKVSEHKALCHALLAKGYMRVLEGSYMGNQPLPTDEENPPLEHWTTKMLCDTICYHLNQSILLAGDVGSGFYEEFFPGSNRAGKKLRPLLVDMLMDNAITPVIGYDLPLSKRKFFEDSRLYGSMSDFLEATREVTADDPYLWQIYVLRRLVNHNMASKPSIRCTVDIRRMTVLGKYLEEDYEWKKNDEEWLKGAVALAQEYTKKVKFSTMFYYMAASKIMDQVRDVPDEKQGSLLTQARDMCIAAQRKWPRSEGAVMCTGIREQIEQKSISFDINQDFLPGERNVARLDYKNVNTAYIKVVEVPGKFKDMAQVDLLSQLNQCTAVAEWSMRVNDPGDYMAHHTMINIPPVMQGCYYLMVSTGPYFGSGECVAYRYIECNGIQFVRLIQDNGTIYGVAVNTRTGQPIPNCKYTLWRCTWDGVAVQVSTSGITSDDGLIMLEGYHNGYFKLELEQGANRGNATFNLPSNTDMPDRYNIRLYTDRYTYLPGDSIQFTGIYYLGRSESGNVIPKTDIQVFANGSRDEVLIGTYTTDEMGVIKGSYKIPDNYMPGRLNLRAQVSGGYENSWTAVNVESFRQPKFEVAIAPCREEVYFDKPVTITGRAKSFTGVPIDSASVEWFAGVRPYCCHDFCLTDERGYVRIGAGNITTDADGKFSFDITVPSEIMIDVNCRVFVYAIVTDLNGETHEASQSLNAASEQDRDIHIACPDYDVISADGRKQFSVWLCSDNGDVSGNIDVKVTRLEWSEKPGLPLPFGVGTNKRVIDELHTAAFNMNLKDKLPLYNFDLKEENVIEIPVYEGTVQFDRDDPKSNKLILEGLQSGAYRISASSPGFKSLTLDYILCREDDYDFVPVKPLLWAYTRNYGNKAEVGDTVNIRLGSSRKGAFIHYYIENRYGVVEHGNLVTNGRQQVLSIPVTKELKGHFAVSCCILYEGVSGNMSFEYEVPDRDKQLKMELVTFRSLLEPDIDEEWKLRITDWQGNPVKAAIMLDMYDRALDTYGTNSFFFQPFNAPYVSGRTLLPRESVRVTQYQTARYEFRRYQYRGKRAVTGMLINPFRNYYVSSRIMGNMAFSDGIALTELTADMIEKVKAYEKHSDLARQTGIDDGEEETVLDLDVAGMADPIGLFDEEEPMMEDALFMKTVNTSPSPQAVPVRTDMNPTGLFEYIVTDSTGMATVNFRTPQLLTEWNIKGLSFTDSLKSVNFDTTLVTRKLLMVEPAAPRYLREGDRLEFTVKVSNLMEQSAKTTVIMTMTDAVTGRTLGIIEGGNKKNITVPAGGNGSTSFTVKVPAGLQAITYRLTAQTTGHSDGMEETIPVLSNRTQIVQSLSLFNNGNEKRSFRFEVLDRPRTGTMENEQLTLEYSATPIWYAVQSLPSMIRLGDLSTLSLFYSMMGAAISDDLCRRYPVIREMLDEWQELPVSEWQTQLERNQDLTGTLLEETPWVMDNRSERDRLHDLAVNLGSAKTEEAFSYGLQRLIATQNYDGGWSWIPGFESSLYVTAEILHGLGQLIENGILEATPDIRRMAQNALNYLDAIYYKEYDNEIKPAFLGYDELYYLLIRSYFQDYKFDGLTKASHHYFSRLANDQETHYADLMYRGQLALLLSRTGKKRDATQVAATIADRALYDDEMGRYWRDNVGGMMWYEAPIETQSLIIRVFLAVGRQTEAVEAARWLLKQKQTTGWATSPATAAAVVALMATGSDTQLSQDPDITIYVGQEALQASTSKATAGLTTKTWTGPISRDKADITIDAKTEGISWGAIYRTFTETLEHVESQSNGITLKRTIWRVIHSAGGDRLEEVKPDTKLHVGDQLKIQFNVETDRNLEYIQLSDMRAATVEPLSTHAGFLYNWRDDIGYYVAPGNTRNVFYIYRLSKGSYVIEYDVKVQKPGHFTVGNAVMQCLYAPAFRATTPSMTITVE